MKAEQNRLMEAGLAERKRMDAERLEQEALEEEQAA